jgi:hypothetical protein
MQVDTNVNKADIGKMPRCTSPLVSQIKTRGPQRSAERRGPHPTDRRTSEISGVSRLAFP